MECQARNKILGIHLNIKGLSVIKKLKLYKLDIYHPKNESFLKKYISNEHENCKDIYEADIVLSASHVVQIEKYPNTKFIFGPHFGKERINEVKHLNTSQNNSIYIQPSQPSVDLWVKELGFTNTIIKAIPFGVNTDIFSPNNKIKKENIFVYYKKM